MADLWRIYYPIFSHYADDSKTFPHSADDSKTFPHFPAPSSGRAALI